MSRRRRGLVLAGLALLLGGLAASDVARREAEVERRLSPAVPVVVARVDVAPGRRVRRSQIAVREVPLRYAPRDAAAAPADVVGARVAAGVPAGAYVTAAHLSLAPAGGAAPVRRGERAAEVVATAALDAVLPGTRVDVLVTRDDGTRAATELALEDVEVLASRRTGAPEDGAPPRVAATLRVRLRDAVYLAAAQSFAREIRLLARAPGDHRRAGALRYGADLR